MQLPGEFLNQKMKVLSTYHLRIILPNLSRPSDNTLMPIQLSLYIEKALFLPDNVYLTCI